MTTHRANFTQACYVRMAEATRCHNENYEPVQSNQRIREFNWDTYARHHAQIVRPAIRTDEKKRFSLNDAAEQAISFEGNVLVVCASFVFICVGIACCYSHRSAKNAERAHEATFEDMLMAVEMDPHDVFHYDFETEFQPPKLTFDRV